MCPTRSPSLLRCALFVASAALLADASFSLAHLRTTLPCSHAQVLAAAKAEVHPWIRLNRVVRDIPAQYILGGAIDPGCTDLRQVCH